MRRCLIVEDSRVIRKVACRIMEEFSFSADEAEDGDSALATCRSNGMPDLILIDDDIPNFNTADFVRGLRRDKDGEKPLILLCVTEIDVPHISNVLGAGANHYLLKPYDRGSLQSRLSDLGFA